MAYAVKDPTDTWVEINPALPFVTYNLETMEVSLSFPPGWADHATQEEREAVGVQPIIEPDTVPGPDKVILRSEIQNALGGKPKRVYVARNISVNELRARMLGQLEALSQQKIADGFPWSFGGVDETLQIRPQDQLNWLIFKNVCDDAIRSSHGSDNCPVPIRVTSNAHYYVTYQQGFDIMIALRTYGIGCLANTWAKKDQIVAATLLNDLLAIDINADWPV